MSGNIVRIFIYLDRNFCRQTVLKTLKTEIKIPINDLDESFIIPEDNYLLNNDFKLNLTNSPNQIQKETIEEIHHDSFCEKNFFKCLYSSGIDSFDENIFKIKNQVSFI